MVKSAWEGYQCATKLHKARAGAQFMRRIPKTADYLNQEQYVFLDCAGEDFGEELPQWWE